MRWFACIALIFLGIAAAADGLADNPALCFGLLSAQSQQETDALRRRKSQVRVMFAKFGPKDSTDERGFDDWQRVGREIAADRGEVRRALLLENCRRLLGPVRPR